MVTVAEAEQIILAQPNDFGSEMVPFISAMGRTLAEPITADRDLPPYNRAMMDGIAISYAAFKAGHRSFPIQAIIAAGDAPVNLAGECRCVEIMTGAAAPANADAIVRYEDLVIKNGVATINTENVKAGQSIHPRGRDRKHGDVVVPAGALVDAAVVSIAASVGKHMLPVYKVPRAVVITTGDELVDVDEQPNPYQIRRSNSYTIKSELLQWGINAELMHIPDEPGTTKSAIEDALGNFDVLLISGGVSAGKYDYVPNALEELGVSKLFHQVQQRPGKPFWFGRTAEGKLVFAFPGNPVSTFLCLHRYFIPWLRQGRALSSGNAKHAVLATDVTFTPAVQYFLQVIVAPDDQGRLMAMPAEGNGSGDFSNLVETNAFMELPLEMSNFKKGEVYRIYPFKKII